MAKKHDPTLNLKDKTCRFGKLSNNTEYAGDDWESAFTFPVSGLMLTKDELNAFRRDKDCHASWFNTRRDLCEPMPWWNGEAFYVSGAFEAEELLILVSGDRELTFAAEEPKDKDDEEDVGRPACVLSKITLKPQVGGLTELCGHLTFRPGLGKQNLILQEHQHREVKITMLDAKAREKAASRQAELPMGNQSGGDDASAAAATH